MTRWIGLLAAAALVVAIPAFAHGQPERAPGSIVAVDFGFQNPADGGPLVTINPGETVNFSYPAGSSFHNVNFTKEQPTSCTLTAGAGPVPPLPAFPSGKGWSGTCTFDEEGTYEFVCQAHDSMLGAVLVVPVGQTPTPTPTSTATPTPTQSATPTAPPTPTPSATPTAQPQSTVAPTPTAPPAAQTSGPAAARLQLARTQRGQAVKGSIGVAQAGSRLRVEVLVKRRRVGTAMRTVGAGTAAFTVKLSAAAKRTLKRSRRLALTVRITVTPPAGPAFTETRKVTLRR